MFSQIFDAIEEWMRELLTGMITSNLDTMFTDVNTKVGTIAGEVGQTPSSWNAGIFLLLLKSESGWTAYCEISETMCSTEEKNSSLIC